MTTDSGHEAVTSERRAGPIVEKQQSAGMLRAAKERNADPNVAKQQSAGIVRAAIVIVLLAGMVYIPSIHGSQVWDDTELLSGKGLGSAVSIPQCFKTAFLFHYYRPLTAASFILDHRIWDHGVWGSNTFGYHLTNLILHVLTTALLIPVLLLAFRSRPVALWGALLFAIQPVQVSTVAWIGGRTDSLCTLFVCLFFLVLISCAKSAGARRAWLLAASVACYALAALAKEQALFLLPLAPMAMFVFRPAPESKTSARVEMIISTVLFTSVAVCLLAAWSRFGQPLHPYWSLKRQLPLIGPTIDYYTLLLVAPTPQLNHIMTLYPMEKLGATGVAAGYIVGLLAIAILVRLMRTDPAAAWFFCGALLLLAPVSNIYPMTTQTIAPYRAGSAGLCIAAAAGWAIVRLLEREESRLPGRINLVAVAAIIYAGWLCCLTYLDDGVWKNSLTASTAVERYDPNSVFGKLETANAYLEFGSFQPAVARLDMVAKSIYALPENGAALDDGLPWSNRAGLADWAGGLYGRAGQLKLKLGDRPTALYVLNKGKALSPKNEQVNAGLANYSLAVNDFATAEGPIRNVLAAQPGLTGLRVRLGKFLELKQRWREADTELTICCAQSPNDVSICLFTAVARIHDGNNIGAANLLNDGLKRNVLQMDKLQDWLQTIGETGLLNVSGVHHDN
jgi:tetratricopeptide (TPR) repeat protein